VAVQRMVEAQANPTATRSLIRYMHRDRSSCGTLGAGCPVGQLLRCGRIPSYLQRIFGELMPRPPNYKQNKQRREDAQKRKNEQEQQRKAERKNRDLPPSSSAP